MNIPPVIASIARKDSGILEDFLTKEGAIFIVTVLAVKMRSACLGLWYQSITRKVESRAKRKRKKKTNMV